MLPFNVSLLRSRGLGISATQPELQLVQSLTKAGSHLPDQSKTIYKDNIHSPPYFLAKNIVIPERNAHQDNEESILYEFHFKTRSGLKKNYKNNKLLQFSRHHVQPTSASSFICQSPDSSQKSPEFSNNKANKD